MCTAMQSCCPCICVISCSVQKFLLKVVSTRHLQSMPSIIATNLESVVILSSSFHWHSIHILDSKVQSLCLLVLRAKMNGAIESKEAIDPFNTIRTTITVY